MYSFAVLEPRSLRSRRRWGHVPSQDSRGERFPASSGIFGLWLRHPTLCLHPHIAPLPLMRRMPVLGPGSAWLIQDDLILRSFTSLHLQRLFPDKITFTGAAAWDLVRPSQRPQLDPPHHLRRRGERHEGQMDTEATQLTRAWCALCVRRGSNRRPCVLTHPVFMVTGAVIIPAL